jgi:hypothetical protein
MSVLDFISYRSMIFSPSVDSDILNCTVLAFLPFSLSMVPNSFYFRTINKGAVVGASEQYCFLTSIGNRFWGFCFLFSWDNGLEIEFRQNIKNSLPGQAYANYHHQSQKSASYVVPVYHLIYVFYIIIQINNQMKH